MDAIKKEFPPLPSWLDASAEVKTVAPPWNKHEFQVECINQLLKLTCNLEQAVGVTAHLMLESARGQAFRGFNLGGVKLWKSTAENFRSATGKNIPWWRDWGHIAQGDPEVCYYRAYPSFSSFLEEWLKSYVPKLTSEPTVKKTDKKKGLVKGCPLLEPEHSADYRLSGAHFHRLNSRSFAPWFKYLILAGYRGAKTKQNWRAAVAGHVALEKEAWLHWAQSRLGVNPDGIWGPKSKAACEQFQLSNGLAVTGIADKATLRKML